MGPMAPSAQPQRLPRAAGDARQAQFMVSWIWWSDIYTQISMFVRIVKVSGPDFVNYKFNWPTITMTAYAN